MPPPPFRKVALALCALLTVLAGCGAQGQTFEVGREVRLLGAVGTLDSENPQIVGMVQAVQLATVEYNDNPDSRYEIEFRQFSTEAGPGEAGAGRGAIAQTARLIGVVGPFTAEEVNELAPGFGQAQMPFLVPSVNMVSAPPEGARSFRRLIANNTQEGDALAAHTADLVTGGIALVTEDSDEGRAFAEGAKQSLESLQRPPVRTESLPPDAGTDTLAAALVEGAPEAVLYGGGGPTGTKLARSLQSAGYQGRLVTSHQVRAQNPDGLAGGVIGSAACVDPADSVAPGFAEQFRQEFGGSPPPCALEAYEGAWMLLEAIEEVEAAAPAVHEFLQAHRSFRGETKQYEFDEAGEMPNAPVWIYESGDSGWSLAGRSNPPPVPEG